MSGKVIRWGTAGSVSGLLDGCWRACLAVSLVTGSIAWSTTLLAAERVDFVRDVQPIFVKHCYACHGAEKQKSGLRLDVKVVALRGGELYGVSIRPGDAASSPLIQLVTDSEVGLRMPPDGDGLSPAEIDTLRRWITEGAVWPDGVDLVQLADPRDHWSFQPLRRPGLPSVRQTAWPLRDWDRFILARLESAKLQPAPSADRATWLRRVTFDLTGLPPTPEAMQRFLADEDEAAWERVVDRLLQSPRYGERWAQHWLDVVRYADTHGFEVNTERPNAWPYRDYVIRAFNRDTPYDQFIREQLLGDQLSEDAATGFLVTASVLLPGQIGKDEPSIRLARQDALDEIVVNISHTFLGLTVGCARCHDHKFDPISQRDYYSLQALVAGVEYGERELLTPEVLARRAERDAAQKRLMEIEQQLTRFAPLAFSGAERPKLNARQNVDRFTPRIAQRLRFTIHQTNNLEPCLDELEVFDLQGRNVALAQAGATVRSSGDRVSPDRHELRFVHDGEYGNSRSWMSNEVGGGWVEVTFAQPTLIERVVWGRDRQEKFQDRLPIDYSITVTTPSGEQMTVADASDRVPLIAPMPSGRRQDRSAQSNLEFEKRIAPAAEAPPSKVPTRNQAKTDDKKTEATASDVKSATSAETRSVESKVAEAPSAEAHLSDSALARQQAAAKISKAAQQERERLQQEQRELTQKLRASEQVEKIFAGTFRQPDAIHLLTRGNPEQPKDRVAPAMLSLFGERVLALDAPDRERRSALADWLTDPTHPLTARVIVNRIWQGHFGRGLVETSNDFGHSGLAPSHPELLDWLACRLIDAKWSMKALHKEIVLSATYRQASRTSDGIVDQRAEVSAEPAAGKSPPEAADASFSKSVGKDGVETKPARAESDAADVTGTSPPAAATAAASSSSGSPEKELMTACGDAIGVYDGLRPEQVDAEIRLLWRYPTRRLDAESIRDSILFVSGQLNGKMYGRGFDLFDKRGGLSGFRPIERFSAEGLRRMIYAHRVRRERDAIFGAFDCPDGGQSTDRRRESTTPIQALNLLNSRFTLDQAEAFAQRVRAEVGEDPERQVERAWQLALQREPTSEELADATDVVRQQGLPLLGRVLFNSNEFLFLP
jgi:hypothetical protein